MIKIQSYPASNFPSDKEMCRSKSPNNVKNQKNQHQILSNLNNINSRNENLKISQTIEKNKSQLKKAIPLKQFEYGQKKMNMNKRTKSQQKLRNSYQQQFMLQSTKHDKMPIKIVKDKMQYEQFVRFHRTHSDNLQNIITSTISNNPQTQASNQQNTKVFISSSPNFCHHLSARQVLQIKERQYRPKLSMFEKFNYENYENYQYKNPFKKNLNPLMKNSEGSHKYDFPKNKKYNQDKGNNKNLEVIYCETKYPDFVKKTNQTLEQPNTDNIDSQNWLLLKTRNSLSNQLQELNNSQKLQTLKKNVIDSMSLKSRELLNEKNITKWKYSSHKVKSLEKSKDPPVSNYSKSNFLFNKKSCSKSSLQKYLQQFKTLQKLTQYNEDEQKANILRKNKKITNQKDFSKTVLLSLFILKFPFLENMNRSIRNHLLKILFDLPAIDEDCKISIHDYLKFNRIFISKDAPLDQMVKFTFDFLFKNVSKPSFKYGKRILEQLNPKNSKKLQNATNELFQICDVNQNQLTSQILIKKVQQKQIWMYNLIQLIRDH